MQMSLACASATAALLLGTVPAHAVEQEISLKLSKSSAAASPSADGLPEGRDKAFERRMSDATRRQGNAAPHVFVAVKRSGRTWFVDRISLSVNSAGQVEPRVVYVNPDASSAIKYATVVLRFYNSVGDLLRSDIGNESGSKLQFTGPLRASDPPKTVQWDSRFYNSTASCVELESLAVEFMDGRKAVFEGARLRDALNPKIKNDCSVRVR
jgi:hypothetical protein